MNKINKQQKKPVDFDEYLAEQLKNPKIKKYYDEYEKQLEVRSAGVSRAEDSRAFKASKILTYCRL